MNNKEPRQLTCACCGGDAGYWQQWWNQDDGYGLCGKCAAWIGKREGIAQLNDHYGIEGIHRESAEHA
jgi:hypothetical protein